MSIIRLIGFSGEIPRMQARQLPSAGARYAASVRLENGGLVPVRKARQEHRFAGFVAGQIKSVYLHDATWLAWTSIVHAAPGPVDQNRLYYTGDGSPKMRVGGSIYDLEMPQPTVALTGVASGAATSSDITTRLYVYTFVSSFGEESEPCPISDEIEWKPGQTVTLNGFQAAPAGRSIVNQRIYRSQTGTSGGTDLYFIAERAASNAPYVDTIAVDGYGEAIPSLDWNAPPSTLQGLISLPNGMMAAFDGKKIYFSEPWRPHAWPEKYVLTTDYNVVGLGAFGSSIVVMTEGMPYIASGTAPEIMLMEKLERNLPCINQRGIVDLGYSVAYPSNDGLVTVSQSGVDVATNSLFAKEDWLQINPGTIVSSHFNGRYFASYEYLGDDGVSNIGTLVFDLGGTPFVIRHEFKADAVYHHLATGRLFYLEGIDLYEFDAANQVNEVLEWNSKEFVSVAMGASFGCILIDGSEITSDAEQAAIEEERAAIIARNEALMVKPLGGEIDGAAFNVFAVNGDPLELIPSSIYVSVRVVADGKVVASVSQMNSIVRLPSGYRARIWSIDVSSNAAISEIIMASSPSELQSASVG